MLPLINAFIFFTVLVSLLNSFFKEDKNRHFFFSSSLSLPKSIYQTYCWAAPEGLKTLYLPSLKTKERARSWQKRHQQCNGWGTLHVWSEVLERHPTVWGRQRVRQGSSLCSQGDREIAVPGEADIRLAYQLLQKPAKERAPPLPPLAPLMHYHSWNSSDLEIRTITIWGWGRHIGIYWWGSMIKREGQSRVQSTGEASTGQGGEVQRAREQPSLVAWQYTYTSNSASFLNFRLGNPNTYLLFQ